MENPEEILRCLEEFTKFKPKDIPRELEEYLCFVAKTGDPVYQWASIKHLLKEKLITVVNEFYESCPWVDIPQCPNVEIFNYETMKSFILEKLDTFAAAPFTVQRICELLTTPRKEYNRIDKFMRALEKNILVVSTIEPGCKNTENGESENVMNGLESEHLPEGSNCSGEINVVEMEESHVWHRNEHQTELQFPEVEDTLLANENEKETACTSSQDDEDDNILADEKKEFSPSDVEEEAPVNSSVEENAEDLINVESLTANNEEEEANNESEPVGSSEGVPEVSESNEANLMENEGSSDDYKEIQPECADNQENIKQADSTTKFQAENEQICENSQDEANSSTNLETSNEKEIEPDTLEENEITPPSNEEEIGISNNADSNEAKENLENYDENSSSTFQEKEEEITSSDKIVVAVPNTSIDDISDDDEAEAENTTKNEEVKEITTESSEILVTAASSCSNDDEDETNSSTKEEEEDCEFQMEVDVLKEKSEFNEAEATTCDSV